jgi:hypothetical protein
MLAGRRRLLWSIGRGISPFAKIKPPQAFHKWALAGAYFADRDSGVNQARNFGCRAIETIDRASAEIVDSRTANAINNAGVHMPAKETQFGHNGPFVFS